MITEIQKVFITIGIFWLGFVFGWVFKMIHYNTLKTKEGEENNKTKTI